MHLIDTANPVDDPRFQIRNIVDLDDLDGGADGTSGKSLKNGLHMRLDSKSHDGLNQI